MTNKIKCNNCYEKYPICKIYEVNGFLVLICEKCLSSKVIRTRKDSLLTEDLKQIKKEIEK